MKPKISFPVVIAIKHEYQSEYRFVDTLDGELRIRRTASQDWSLLFDDGTFVQNLHDEDEVRSFVRDKFPHLSRMKVQFYPSSKPTTETRICRSGYSITSIREYSIILS